MWILLAYQIEEMNKLAIVMRKKRKGDRLFALPDRCLFCAAPNPTVDTRVANKHSSAISVLACVLMPLLFLFVIFEDRTPGCNGRACHACARISQASNRINRWIWIKWLLFSILLAVLGWKVTVWLSLPAGWVALVVFLASVVLGFVMHFRRQKAIDTLIEQINPEHEPETLLQDLQVGPVGFSVSNKAARYQLSAQVGHHEFIRQFIEMNQATSDIVYNQDDYQAIQSTRTM